MPDTVVENFKNGPDEQINSLGSEPSINPTINRRFPSRLSEIQRSDSIRSHTSDTSTASESKRVSFNNDVKIKTIPKSKLATPTSHQGQQQSQQQQQYAHYQSQAPPSDPKEIEAEAERILKQLSLVECSVSSTAPTNTSTNSNSALFKPVNFSSHQQASDSDTAGPSFVRSRAASLDFSGNNPLYGLHALNNLDIAVNGKEVNSMPSYREIRRRGLDGSIASDDNSTILDKYEGIHPPPKPPRKAPSTSPPSLRRSDAVMTHYARPVTIGSPSPSQFDQLLSRDDNLRKRFVDNNNDDSAIASGGDGGGTDDASGSNPSFSFHGPGSGNHRSTPMDSISPSRSCMTDSEILRSPTEVLYAVSEKRKNRENIGNVKSISASVQTVRSELRQNPPGFYAKHSARPHRNLSREDLLTDESSYVSTGRRGASLQQEPRVVSTSYGSKFNNHGSRSLERFLDNDDKENTFKTRIQVISPDRGPSPDPARRKPYKTMINTATDNIIQYRVDSAENLRYQDFYKHNNDDNNEHYKVPRNKAPVIEEYYLRHHQQQPPHQPLLHQQSTLRRKPNYNRNNEDSDFSSASYSQQQQQYRANGVKSQFTSTGLVKNVENRRFRPNGTTREVDREGRSIRRDGRHYSGCSTSPDRDASPERYARPNANVNGIYQYKMTSIRSSPDPSPIRPTRSRSSPIRDLVNRLNGTNGHSDLDSYSRNYNGVSVSREPSTLRQQSAIRRKDSGEDRLSRFTEYRGEDVVDLSRRSSITDQTVSDRERGRSLPPGANVESLRDLQKASQFKSMYALPPSPTRPAPVLERSQSRRPTRISISEGEMTDDALGITRASKVVPSGLRPSTKRPAPSPPGMVNGGPRRIASNDRVSARPVTREPSQRIAPPRRVPVGVNRRGSSVDGLDSSYSESEGINGDAEKQTQPWSSLSDDEDLEDEVGLVLAAIDDERPVSGISSQYKRPSSVATSATIVHVHKRDPRPIMMPTARDRRSQVIYHDKSASTYHTIIKDKQPLGDFGRRWSAHHSDVDSDYRRELATNGNGLHQEARLRDGGSSILSKSRMTGSKGNVRIGIEDPDSIMRDLNEEEDDNITYSDRSHVNPLSSSREEERRKVLEIEEERVRLEREAQLRRIGAPNTLNGTANRTGRTAHIHAAGLRRAGHKLNGISNVDTVDPPGLNGVGQAKINRYDQFRSNSRVRRTASNATSNTTAAVGGVRREIVNQRKKLPGGSLTSSVNSSESDRGSHAGQSGVSRSATDASRRSVFLHAAAVVDIPSAGDRPSRALSADHKINGQPARPATDTNLKNSKKISRSISLLAPWKPKNYRDKFEVIHYDNKNLYNSPPTSVTVGPSGTTSTSNGTSIGKPPRPPVPPVTRPLPNDKKSASSTDLLRDSDGGRAAPQASNGSVLERRAQTLQRPNSAKVSRSLSMPKDSRLAGWFKKRKKI